MALNVPDSPKVYTTKYQNWRGVDYTNDPSNVWYRRSPNGLNMLPNLDGQPFKRNGWKVELSSADFCTAAGVASQLVTQYKVDYFELGGTEYLWFYTSLGCFVYGSTLTFIDKSYQIGDDKPYEYSIGQTYDEGDYCSYEGDTYQCVNEIETPKQWDADDWEATTDCWTAFPPTGKNVDYSKAFFFEGGGRAGYYLFVDDTMYWFDGTVLHEAKPTIPVVLTMADATGAGTLLEDVNMLTPWRAIEYLCDGNTTTYVIPDGAESILNVYTINPDGSLTPNYDWTLYNTGQLVFGTAPQETRPNQPSMRVVYATANASFEQETVTTKGYGIVITKDSITLQAQRYVNKKWTNYGEPKTTTDYLVNTAPTIPLANATMPLNIQVDTQSGLMVVTDDWDENVSDITVTPNAYGDTVTLTGGKGVFNRYPNDHPFTDTSTTYTGVSSTKRTKRTVQQTRFSFNARIKYSQWNVSYGDSGNGRSAFFATSKSLVFGNGIINQVFLTASKYEAYSTRVWYSMHTDPLYFPDTNYIEVGATDKKIMGLIRVDDYLGIIKQGSATDTSVYLAYPTSFEDVTTYAVKQSVNGIGAVSNGAFNILNGEPLFLSAEGVMGIEFAEDESRKVRNRSYYINKKLLAEPSLESAFSFVYGGMYWLCVNNHCYVLDGSQKISWENTKTNLQYECYYLENVPAKCFARKDGFLWFTDNRGNVCRFKGDNEELRYVDAYDSSDASNHYTALVAPSSGVIPSAQIRGLKNEKWSIGIKSGDYVALLNGYYENGFTRNATAGAVDVVSVEFVIKYDNADPITYTPDFSEGESSGQIQIIVPAGAEAFAPPNIEHVNNVNFSWVQTVVSGEVTVEVGDIIIYNSEYYTAVGVTDDDVYVTYGVPIPARWGTIADDDGSAHYYKKLQKRGSLVALMPMSDSGVKVYLIPDEQEPIFVGETDIGSHVLPFNYYLRKKVKNYKRLQIVCENDSYNDGFGVDEIIKSYTIGNYAKR